MKRKLLIYGMILILIFSVLFVLTGCSNNEEQENLKKDMSETNVIVDDGDSNITNSEDERILDEIFDDYGLKGEDLLPNFIYEKVVKDEKAEGAAYVVLNDRLLTEEEKTNYLNRLIDACASAADHGLVYEMRGEELVEKGTEEAGFGVYIYKRNDVTYRFSCDQPAAVGEPIMLTATIVK